MLSIVVPTYKEAGNLPQLAARVAEVMSGTSVTWEMLIVDDCSPDETVSVCETLATEFPLRLLQPTGRARDLSLSVIDGIRAVTYDRVLVMDADLSHPPEQIPGMLALIEQNPQAFVVGSRYVEGGSFDRQWSWWRFLNSHIATMLARPLVRCSDPMSGFFAFDRTRIEDVSCLKPIGYKIGLEIMVRGKFSDVLEVPIGFVDREIGTSKMNLQQQFNYLRHLRRLYLHRFGSFAEFIHFGAVGASGFVIDILFYYLFQAFGASHLVSRALSFWPAVSWNWALNRLTTFGERQRRPRGRQWFEFVLTSGLGFSINFGVYYYLTTSTGFFAQYHIAALLTGIACASFFNFTLSTLFVYSDKRQ